LNTLSRRYRYLLATLSGLLLGLAFPPTGLAGGLLAFIAIVPLLVALESAASLRKTFYTSFVAMFVLGLVSNYWVGGWKSFSEADPFLMLGGVLLAIVHPFFLVVPFLLYDVVRRRFSRIAALYSLPIFQAGFEYAHSFGDLSYPWLNLYDTQSYNLPYIQHLEYTGPYFLSILIVLINVQLFQLVRDEKQTLRHSLILVALIAIPYLQGFVAMNGKEDSKTSMRITIVQPNIDPWAKWQVDVERTLDTNVRATRTALSAVHDSTDLVLWPETAITFEITSPRNEYWLGVFYNWLSRMRHPVLTGFPDVEEYESGKDLVPSDARYTGVGNFYVRMWNAAMLVYHDSTQGFKREVYHKQKLVPLGEHVPFVQYFPFLGKWFQWGVGLGSWNYGEGYEPIGMPVGSDSLHIIPAICYESVYPSFLRHFVNNGANLLAVITNDGWYGRSSGPYQHEQFAVLRAIENRRYLVRSANTGISCVIDDRGRTIRQLLLFESGSITERVPLIERKTLYTRLGDFIAIPAMLYALVIFIYVFVTWLVTRRSKNISV
jgi:apolipoprotein N-acyltransferase